MVGKYRLQGGGLVLEEDADREPREVPVAPPELERDDPRHRHAPRGAELAGRGDRGARTVDEAHQVGADPGDLARVEQCAEGRLEQLAGVVAQRRGQPAVEGLNAGREVDQHPHRCGTEGVHRGPDQRTVGTPRCSTAHETTWVATGTPPPRRGLRSNPSARRGSAGEVQACIGPVHPVFSRRCVVRLRRSVVGHRCLADEHSPPFLTIVIGEIPGGPPPPDHPTPVDPTEATTPWQPPTSVSISASINSAGATRRTTSSSPSGASTTPSSRRCRG